MKGRKKEKPDEDAILREKLEAQNRALKKVLDRIVIGGRKNGSKKKQDRLP